jgi:hypothetical protein
VHASWLFFCLCKVPHLRFDLDPAHTIRHFALYIKVLLSYPLVALHPYSLTFLDSYILLALRPYPLIAGDAPVDPWQQLSLHRRPRVLSYTDMHKPSRPILLECPQVLKSYPKVPVSPHV